MESQLTQQQLAEQLAAFSESVDGAIRVINENAKDPQQADQFAADYLQNEEPGFPRQLYTQLNTSLMELDADAANAILDAINALSYNGLMSMSSALKYLQSRVSGVGLGSPSSTVSPQTSAGFGSPITPQSSGPSFGFTNVTAPPNQVGTFPSAGYQGSPVFGSAATVQPSAGQVDFGYNPLAGIKLETPAPQIIGGSHQEFDIFRADKIRGGPQTLLRLSQILGPLVQSTHEDSNNKFLAGLRNANVYTVDGTPITDRLSKVPADYTVAYRQAILNAVIKGSQLSSATSAEGVVSETRSPLLNQIQIFDFNQLGGVKEGGRKKGAAKTKTKTKRQVMLILAKKPQITGDTPEKQRESAIQVATYESLFQSSYSASSAATHARVIKELLQANYVVAEYFGKHTYMDPNIGVLVINAPSGATASYIKNGSYMIDHDTYQAMVNNAKILSNNLALARTIGRKGRVPTRDFTKGNGKAVFLVDQFIEWLKIESFGVVNNQTSREGCYVTDGFSGGQNKQYWFECALPSFWQGFNDTAAAEYVKLGGSVDEYRNIVRMVSSITGNQSNTLVGAGLARYNTVNRFFDVARAAFGFYGGYQNINLASNQNKILVGAQNESSRPKAGGVGTTYKVSDAMMSILNDPSRPADFIYSSDSETRSVVPQQGGNKTVLSSAVETSNRGKRPDATNLVRIPDRVPQQVFKTITKLLYVHGGNGLNDAESGILASLAANGADENQGISALNGNVTVLQLKNALLAEDNAISAYKDTISRIIKNSKDLVASRLAAEKRQK